MVAIYGIKFRHLRHPELSIEDSSNEHDLIYLSIFSYYNPILRVFVPTLYSVFQLDIQTTQMPTAGLK